MNNITELTPLITPALMVPLLPLIGFFVVALFGKKLGHASGWIASLMILASFICSLFLFNGLSSGKSLNFDVYEWIKSIKEINVDGVLPMYNVNECEYRTVRTIENPEFFSPAVVLANTPKKADDFILVPKVIE